MLRSLYESTPSEEKKKKQERKKVTFVFRASHCPQDPILDLKDATGTPSYGPLIKVQFTPKSNRWFSAQSHISGKVTLIAGMLGGAQEPGSREPYYSTK